MDLTQAVIQQIPRLRRYARALTGDASRADDLVQDTLERAWSRLHLWQPSGEIRAWLLTMMHNLFANQVRHHARAPTLVPLSEAGLEREPVRRQDTDSLELSDLQIALAVLPKEQREVILLVGLEQLSYQEAAGILGIPLGTVMSRLARGRERLRQALGLSESRLRSVK